MEERLKDKSEKISVVQLSYYPMPLIFHLQDSLYPSENVSLSSDER